MMILLLGVDVLTVAGQSAGVALQATFGDLIGIGVIVSQCFQAPSTVLKTSGYHYLALGAARLSSSLPQCLRGL